MLKNLHKQRGTADNTPVRPLLFVVCIFSPECTEKYNSKFNYLYALIQTLNQYFKMFFTCSICLGRPKSLYYKYVKQNLFFFFAGFKQTAFYSC